MADRVCIDRVYRLPYAMPKILTHLAYENAWTTGVNGRTTVRVRANSVWL